MAAGPAVAWVCAALVLTGACRSGDKPAGARRSDPAASDNRRPERDQIALDRGQRMTGQAEACASTDGDPPAAAHERACRTACDLGHSNSCHATGALAEVAARIDEATWWYRRACDGGSGLGCEALARLARAATPRSTDADALDRKARFYLRVHCEQRHAPSCAGLARLFATGLGGARRPALARTFLERACTYGADDACAALGRGEAGRPPPGR